MRAIALKQGFSMNEYRMTHKTTKLPVQIGTIMGKIGNTRFEYEKDIFTFLDIGYVKPKNRNAQILKSFGF